MAARSSQPGSPRMSPGDLEEGSAVSSEECPREDTAGRERRIARVRKHAKSAHNMKKIFKKHLLVALSVGFWVAVFGLPIYSVRLNYTIFGQREAVINAMKQRNATIKSQQLGLSCEDTYTGKLRNVAPLGSEPQWQLWDDTMSSPWHEANLTDIWCGYVPRSYADNWPNVAQFIVFTVFRSTGTTINFAVQGIVGTVLATMNMHFMTWIFPQGARGQVCTGLTEGCVPGSTVYVDPNYANFGELVCMLDVLLVLLLFLLSKSARNTIMFGMSWHVVWMMNFMNPAIGVSAPDKGSHWWRWTLTDYFAVEATTLLGAVTAVVATLLPKAKVQNLQGMYDEAMAVNYSIAKIWSEAVEYLGGSRRSAVRFQIETRIDAIDELASEVQDNSSGAWWETFDLGSAGRKRRLLERFDTNAMDIKDLLYVVKTCVLAETFDDSGAEHGIFWKKLQYAVGELTVNTSDLMWLCLETFEDGDMNEDEIDRIDQQLGKVADSRTSLVSAFQRAEPSISEELPEEQTFIFALACWSRKSSDFAAKIVESARSGKLHQNGSFIRVLIQGVCRTWDPKEIMQVDHLKYVLRNWLSIVACFFIGYYGNGSIFSRYNYVMAMTLTLLFVREGSHHVEYEQCAHRLLGVALGKSLPIIIGCLLDTFECDSLIGLPVQILAVWAYVSTWCFLYYNSEKWSYVSCLIGGFGIYQLMTPRCSSLSQDEMFISKYKEIGNVIMAILIQAVLYALLSRTSARKLLSARLQGFGLALEEAFQALFDADITRMQVAVREASSELAVAKVLAPECDPKLRLYRGRKAPLKMDVCNGILSFSEQLVGQLGMLVVAEKDWVPNKAALGLDGDDGKEEGETSFGILEMLKRCPSMAVVKDNLLPDVAMLAAVLPGMIAARDRSAWQDKLRKPQEVSASVQLQGAGQLYKELAARCRNRSGESQEDLTNDARVRLTIAVWSLQNSAYHIGKIEERCMKEATC